MKKPLIALGIGTIASVALVACSGATEDPAASVASSAPAAAESAVNSATSEAMQDDDMERDDDMQESVPAQQNEQLPAAVSGYTDEARQELEEDGVSEADVERVLAAANANEAGVDIEWDNDSGYFEIEFQEIDIDIRPDGTVTGVDR